MLYICILPPNPRLHAAPGFDALDEAMPEELEVAEAASHF